MIETDTLPRMRELPVFEGAMLFYERESGEAQSLVFWRDSEFMQAASGVAELERSPLAELARGEPSEKVCEIASVPLGEDSARAEWPPAVGQRPLRVEARGRTSRLGRCRLDPPRPRPWR